MEREFERRDYQRELDYTPVGQTGQSTAEIENFKSSSTKSVLQSDHGTSRYIPRAEKKKHTSTGKHSGRNHDQNGEESGDDIKTVTETVGYTIS